MAAVVHTLLMMTDGEKSKKNGKRERESGKREREKVGGREGEGVRKRVSYKGVL